MVRPTHRFQFERTHIVPAQDGRVLRAARTRTNILSAYLMLVRRDLSEPTIRQIAEVAGCASRSVYERMSNKDSLRLAALDHALKTTRRPASPALREADRSSRLKAIVHRQVGEYLKWGPLCFLLSACFSSVDIQERLDRVRYNLLKDHFDECYRQELQGTRDADVWLEIISATTSLENWHELRYRQQQTPDLICEHWERWIGDVCEAALSQPTT
jgi:AcrR family transcriptional regulator